MLGSWSAWPALAWTGALRAQANTPVLISWLSANHRDTGRGGVDAFVDGMAALGWKPGAHYVLEERHADGRRERLAALAQEIAAKKPVLIVAEPSTSARAAAAAAPTTPIVLANGDPLSTGLVTSLARPGGMITGLSNATYDIYQKVVELLVEALPRLPRVGFLVDSNSASIRAATVKLVRSAAEQLRVEAFIVDVARPEDIEPAFAQLTRDKAQEVVVLPSAWIFPQYPKILGLAGNRKSCPLRPAPARWHEPGLTRWERTA